MQFRALRKPPALAAGGGAAIIARMHAPLALAFAAASAAASAGAFEFEALEGAGVEPLSARLTGAIEAVLP